MYLSYTYYLRNIVTNQFYYGSRYKNTKLKLTPQEDFWKMYFTSSDRVKTLIQQHGVDSFEFQIIKESTTYDDCYWYEQALIKQHVKDPLCLNTIYVDLANNSTQFSFAGKTHSEETKSIISTRQSGERNSFYGKSQSVESNLKRAEWTIANKTGKQLSEETKAKIGNSLLGKERKPFTAEHKQRMRESAIAAHANRKIAKT